LTMLTMLLALVPFVGAASVWIPTCLWIWLFEHRLAAACILAGYCAAVVSNIDNLIKPLVLHGQANLHPLLALISVLGGVQVLGPIGILVGPMLVAFVQALLVMVNRELQLWSEGDESRTTSEPNHEPLADQSKALSERPIRDHPSTDLDETSFDSDSSASVSDASPRGKSSPINPRRAGKRRRRRKRR
ncbi:MAG: AI-2E family transporter, partial [Planctomycetota bacterium]